MKLSVELTLYPLQDDYLSIIKATIKKLNTFDDVHIETFPTATILMGEHDRVMAILSHCIKWSYDSYGKCVFVAKFLPGYEAL